MNIREVEMRTGITKQNIRFYEKKELLHPQRNSENSYREYTEAEVETLQKIKIYRKLDFSIEDIRRILNGEEQETLIQAHLKELEEKKSSLDAAIKICRFLLRTEAGSVNTEDLLREMEDVERKGGYFMNILNDYKKVSKAEKKRKFSFSPCNMALTREEFTEALYRYGDENNLNLVITKESMYPKFEIDGVEYEAHREFGRYGAVIYCEMTHPELTQEEYSDIPKERSSIYRRIYWGIFYLAVPIAMFLYFTLVSGSLLLALLLELIYIPIVRFTYGSFRIRP